MRIFLATLILIITFQSFTRADDIRDFQIEDMSIGDSALDFYSKSEIDNQKKYYANSKKFFRAALIAKSGNFERVQLHIKENDNNYIIYGISGLNFFRDKKNSEKECLEMHKIIKKDISLMLKNIKGTKLKKRKIDQDKTGNSVHYPIYFDFNDEKTEFIKLDCVIYGKEYFKQYGFYDHLRLGVQSAEYTYWLDNEAFNN